MTEAETFIESINRSLINQFTIDFLVKEERYIKTLRPGSVYSFLKDFEDEFLSSLKDDGEDEDDILWYEGIALTTLIEQSENDSLPIDYPDIECYLSHARYYHKPIKKKG